MFAAVMRKAGVPKQLECHGFVCDSPEEAILVAANLYQALLETMKRNKRPNSSSQVRRAPVSELYLGVTTAVPTLWCLGPIVWSRVKAASFLVVVGLVRRTSGQRGRVQLSGGQGVRTGGGVKDGRNYHEEAVGCRCAAG